MRVRPSWCWSRWRRSPSCDPLDAPFVLATATSWSTSERAGYRRCRRWTGSPPEWGRACRAHRGQPCQRPRRPSRHVRPGGGRGRCSHDSGTRRSVRRLRRNGKIHPCGRRRLSRHRERTVQTLHRREGGRRLLRAPRLPVAVRLYGQDLDVLRGKAETGWWPGDLGRRKGIVAPHMELEPADGAPASTSRPNSSESRPLRRGTGRRGVCSAARLTALWHRRR